MKTNNTVILGANKLLKTVLNKQAKSNQNFSNKILLPLMDKNSKKILVNMVKTRRVNLKNSKACQTVPTNTNKSVGVQTEVTENNAAEQHSPKPVSLLLNQHYGSFMSLIKHPFAVNHPPKNIRPKPSITKK